MATKKDNIALAVIAASAIGMGLWIYQKKRLWVYPAFNIRIQPVRWSSEKKRWEFYGESYFFPEGERMGFLFRRVKDSSGRELLLIRSDREDSNGKIFAFDKESSLDPDSLTIYFEERKFNKLPV
jgi:hypothetical protein